jgi:hypothetical protein
LTAGIIGVTSETEHRLRESAAELGLEANAYESIPTHLNKAAAHIGSIFNEIPEESQLGKIKVTLSDTWKSPAFAVKVACVANTVEALLRGNYIRAGISFVYLCGSFAAAHQVENSLNIEGNQNPRGVFAGIRSCYSDRMPDRFKAVLNNTGFWYPAGNAATMLEQGVQTLTNPFGAIGFGIAAVATATALIPLFKKDQRQTMSDGSDVSPPHQFWLVSAVGGFVERGLELTVGPRAGRAQRFGAIGDFLASVNSFTTGHPFNGVAFSHWGISNWQHGGLSNKAAAEAAAANQAQQAR